MITKEVHQYMTDGEFVQTFPSARHASLWFTEHLDPVKDIAEINSQSVNPELIHKACKISKVFRGFVWSYDKPNRGRKVDQFTPDGIYIKTFASAGCVGANVTPKDSIYKACKQRYGVAGGFLWRYHNGDISAKDVRVDQLTKKGAHLRTFKSPYAAGKRLNLNAINIYKACKSGNALGGYCWKFSLSID